MDNLAFLFLLVICGPVVLVTAYATIHNALEDLLYGSNPETVPRLE